MKYFLVLFFIFFVVKPGFAYNIFERGAFFISIPLLYSQYFDSSLSSEQDYQRKKNVFRKQLSFKNSKIINSIPRSSADMIYFLDVIEELNIKNKYYK